MKLYLVRHGETDMNVRNMFYGWTDADINAKGVLQAEQLRETFRDIPLDAIYASDLKRALHTAEIIAESRPIQTMPELRELHYGRWENRTWAEMTEEDRAALQEWRTDWEDCTMPEGESFREFYDRVTAGLDRIMRENKGRHVLIVSHNGALSAMHCYLTGAGPKGFWNFNSKQGHYSAVWASDKKLTYDCFNYPAKTEKTETVYVDIDSAPADDLCYLPHREQIRYHLLWTGTKLEPHMEQADYVEKLKNALDFIFLEETDEIPAWYAVPALVLFAKDSKGGWFARKKGAEAVYYIGADGQVTYLAENLRAYLQMVFFAEGKEPHPLVGELRLTPPKTDLRRFVCPAYDVRLFADRQAAEQEIAIHGWSEFMGEGEKQFQLR